MVSNCDIFPKTVTAGLSFQATVNLSDYPAPEWELRAFLRGKQNIDLLAAADGVLHVFSADAATTAAWATGAYWYSLRATKGTQVVEIAKGQIDVLPDLATVTGTYDGRTENQKALEAIDAVLAKRATLDQERYRINNRELYRTPIGDLMKLRSFYVAAVRREKNANCGKSTFGRRINVRFSS